MKTCYSTLKLFFLLFFLLLFIPSLFSQTGFVMGENGTLIKTTDGGITWVSKVIGNSETLWESYFINNQTGWVAQGTMEGTPGLIIKTTDQGETWIQQFITNSCWFTNVWFINNQLGYAVGSAQKVIKTTNGGTNWDFINFLPGSTELETVFFPDSLTGFITGWNGFLCKSSDAGNNWLALTSGTSNNLYASYFRNHNLGWVAGQGGTIISTTNSGSNWTVQPSGTSEQIFSIFFINDITGWAVGNQGAIVKTTNSGNSWSPQTSGTTIRLEIVDFVNQLTGWAAGGWSGSVIIKTTNGGTNWVTQSGGVNQRFFSAWFFPQPIHDISVGPFLSFPGQFFTNTQYSIKTKVQNVGSTNESAIPVKFYINGIFMNTSNLNLNIGQTDSINNNWTPVSAGTYTLKYISSLPTDSNYSNDTVQTTINVNVSNPALCEGFSSTTFPPSGWSIIYTGNIFWERQSISGFGLGTGCAEFDNYDAPYGIAQNLVTTTFQPTASTNEGVKFDIAYCPWSSYPDDSLIILSSTDGGTTFSLLVRLGENQLGTISSCTHPFTPAPNDWGTRAYYVPLGTNKISFRAVSGYGDYLYIDSVCIVDLSGVIKKYNEIPVDFSLSQNYPNPFNIETKIPFALSKASNVKLAIYDMKGSEIAVLVNENMKAGYYEVSFNGADLATGVYFYRLSTSNYTNVKKMVLLK